MAVCRKQLLRFFLKKLGHPLLQPAIVLALLSYVRSSIFVKHASFHRRHIIVVVRAVAGGVAAGWRKFDTIEGCAVKEEEEERGGLLFLKQGSFFFCLRRKQDQKQS